MTTYTATFRTAHSWATHDIESDAPAQALEQAQALAEADDGTLDWCAYDPASTPLEEIEIEGPAGESALWQSDELGLRLAAGDLLEALELAVQALNTVPRFKMPALETDSYKIAAICDQALARAKPVMP